LKVSIITVVFNGASTLRSCIDSVLAQDYDSIEYIVVDGKSTDATVEIVKSYGDSIHKFISEPDKGIYDAMNKGIALANGDVIGILNADDFYAYDTVISDIASVMRSANADGVYGDLQYVDSLDLNKIKRNWKSGQYKAGSFVTGWMPPHPTFFLKKSMYEKFGNFRLDLGSAADYELMLRIIHKFEIKLAYVPKVLVKMRAGGVSNSNISNRVAANKNDRLAWKINDLQPKLYTLWLKPIRKVLQFI
jgi:glycosyltransferase involved in cell wall biosynthesis